MAAPLVPVVMKALSWGGGLLTRRAATKTAVQFAGENVKAVARDGMIKGALKGTAKFLGKLSAIGTGLWGANEISKATTGENLIKNGLDLASDEIAGPILDHFAEDGENAASHGFGQRIINIANALANAPELFGIDWGKLFAGFAENLRGWGDRIQNATNENGGTAAVDIKNNAPDTSAAFSKSTAPNEPANEKTASVTNLDSSNKKVASLLLPEFSNSVSVNSPYPGVFNQVAAALSPLAAPTRAVGFNPNEAFA